MYRNTLLFTDYVLEDYCLSLCQTESGKLWDRADQNKCLLKSFSLDLFNTFSSKIIIQFLKSSDLKLVMNENNQLQKAK